MKKKRHDSIRISGEVRQVLRDLSDVARYLWERGWAEGNAGNLSVDVTGFVGERVRDLARYPFTEVETPLEGLDGRCFLTTISGSRMRHVSASHEENTCIIRISEKLHGYHIIWGNKRQPPGVPTSELPSHLTIHRHFLQQKSHRKAVVHTHPTELIALTQTAQYASEEKLNHLLWAMHPESIIAIPEGVGFIPYMLSGTDEIAQVTAASLDTHNVVLWEKHGCLATGVNVFEAFDLIDIVAKAAQIYFLCAGAGLSPQGLTQAQIEELKRKYVMKE